MLFIYNVFSSIDTACLHNQARHVKTEPIETVVALCFGIPENTMQCLRANWNCVNWLDEEGISAVTNLFYELIVTKEPDIFVEM
jgi:hypothetical protein